jgi:hypothetical protein
MPSSLGIQGTPLLIHIRQCFKGHLGHWSEIVIFCLTVSSVIQKRDLGAFMARGLFLLNLNWEDSMKSMQ